MTFPRAWYAVPLSLTSCPITAISSRIVMTPGSYVRCSGA